MRLTAMAKAFKDQLTDPNISKMSFEDRFGLLVDQEWSSRKNCSIRAAEVFSFVRRIQYLLNYGVIKQLTRTIGD